ILKLASIGDLIRDSAAFVLRGSNTKCEFHIPDDLRPVNVDGGQMSQVINNLIINADHAMPEGGIIRVVAENVVVGNENSEGGLALDPGEYVKISIHDQGVGIPKDHLHKVFDPYFTTKERGSGLGLTTTLSIIKKHRGHITVDSVKGRGTTVHVFLPASRIAICDTGGPGEGGHLPSGRGRILVMDDEEVLRNLIRDALTALGYEVQSAAEGNEALAYYSRAMTNGRPFDVVLMDLTIPGGMGGKEAIRRLQEIDPKVKAIASSGYSNDPIMAEFARYGFSAVLAKPYKIEELCGILRMVLMQPSPGPMS
ncbi:MAG: response regulator, partial [Deltaproteobacteria bacterium]|nr:response regulator [Deltaproteobacteria bacterium]